MYNQEEEIEKEKRRELLLLPFVIIICIGYAALYVFFICDSPGNDVRLWGMAKNIWLIGLLFFGGIAAVSMLGSLTTLIWIHLLAIQLHSKVRQSYALSTSTILFVVSLGAFATGQWLDSTVRSNASSINKYLFPGESQIPFYWDSISLLVALFLFIVFSSIMYGLVMLPFQAKRHAKELMSK